MNYPVEAEDIIDSVPQVKDAVFAVYNHGFMEGIKEGKRLALKDTKGPEFTVIRSLEDQIKTLLDRNSVLANMYNKSISSKKLEVS
tara:strand:+ start:20635 stop:20892 length:258 start_codon:yes stop_codon:yes gene_type:complete